MINILKENAVHKREIDLLIIGGGATGAGAALDARLRGMNVVCIEMEDFSSGTSSRSTKLIWGGSRYLVQAFINLLNPDLRLVRSPIQTITKFLEDFKMVLNCHRERKFLLDTQPHLTNWLPIAVPLTQWIQWPPPFGFPPAALGAFGLFPLFFKFYDSLTGFTCPPSHIMTPSRAKRKFPQLANSKIKYSPIFYEGQHDDARTNLALAQTAAQEGAVVINYCALQNLIYADDNSGKVVGGIVLDLKTNSSIEIRSKSILFAGGPFTDSLRKFEDKNCKNAVNGASGIHIVLPSYFAPSGIGLVDMNTSDGRFLFFLPWMGHVVVGTTDRKCEISTRPEPEESEIKWLLNEASKFLSPELSIRREDVLSAWSGIRPLAMDPHASSTAAASRDHIISVNPKTGTIFIAGGKWTTYREMAEDAIDKVIEVAKLEKIFTKKCSTLTTPLIGLKGYSSNLHIRLIQEYGIASSVAKRLSKAYGGRAHEVLRIAKEELGMIGRGDRLVPGYPYLEAEVIYAVRHEWALTADDIIARRTRLAFLNKDAAIRAIPKVVKIGRAHV
jgi:glycerol-3-phosphate dehydrogenase